MSERRHDYAQARGSPRVTFPLPSLRACLCHHLLSFFTACDSPHPWTAPTRLIPSKPPTSQQTHRWTTPGSVWSRLTPLSGNVCRGDSGEFLPEPQTCGVDELWRLTYRGKDPGAEKCDLQENEALFYTHNVFTKAKIQWRCVFLFHQTSFLLTDYFKNHNRLKRVLTPPLPATRWQIPPLPLEPSEGLG